MYVTFHNKQHHKKTQLECEPVPNVMVALPNIGGALCSTPQSLADAHCSAGVLHSNAAKMRNKPVDIHRGAPN